MTEQHTAETAGGPTSGRPATRDLAEEAHEQLLTADTLTADELQRLIDLAGRNYGPEFLYEAWAEDKIQAPQVAALIGGIWSRTEFPDCYIDQDDWRWLFKVAGFTIDGQRTERPTEPIQLWRGSVPERKTDWSWSTDRAVAEKYAFGGMNYRPTGRLYTVTAPPHALLCANNGRDEAEYVIDTFGLDIREVTR